MAGCAGAPDQDQAVAPAAPSPSPAAPRSDDAPAEPEPAPSPELSLATFDAVWWRIETTDFEVDHGGVDWSAVRDELRPRAAAATSPGELRTVLSTMLARLGRSHFAIIPGNVADRPITGPPASNGATVAVPGPPVHAPRAATDLADATFGLSLRLVEGAVTVTGVSPDSSAAEAGVERGWVLLRIDGRDAAAGTSDVGAASRSFARYFIEDSVRNLDRGGAASHELVFLDGNDSTRTLALERRPSTSRVVKSGSLPPMPLVVDSGWIDRETLTRAGADGLRIGVIRFSVWLPDAAPFIDRAVDELRDADGVIIDLRGNPGGYGGMAMGVGGHFIGRSAGLGTMITRDGVFEFEIHPRRATTDGHLVEPISAPLAILIDPLSASTSEIFAGGMQDLGRARLFGEPSAGAALPAQMYRLPNGDVLVHAIADFLLPSGTRIEGAGVVPNEPRTLTRRDLMDQGDPVLLDALRWIRTVRRAVP